MEGRLLGHLRRNLPGPARIKVLDRLIELEADSEDDPMAEARMHMENVVPKD